jgi:hypothetical protein
MQAAGANGAVTPAGRLRRADLNSWGQSTSLREWSDPQGLKFQATP